MMVPMMVDLGETRIDASKVITETTVRTKDGAFLVLTFGFAVQVPNPDRLAPDAPPLIWTAYQVTIPPSLVDRYRNEAARLRGEALDAIAGVVDETDPDLLDDDDSEPDPPVRSLRGESKN